MTTQETAGRLDRVRMHLHSALEELHGDDGGDAHAIRVPLVALQRQLERIRRRQASEWVNRSFDEKKT